MTTCGNYKIVGGFQKFGQDVEAGKRFKNLPPHYSARIRLSCLRIDDWNSEIFYIKVDGNAPVLSEQYSATAASSENPDSCGSAALADNEITHSVTFTHSASELKVQIYSNLNAAANLEAWGFSNFELVIYKCHSNCNSCFGPAEGDCGTCPPCGPLICGDYYYSSSSSAPCGCPSCARCHISCKTCDGPGANNCLSCEIEDSLTGGTCAYASSKKITLNFSS